MFDTNAQDPRSTFSGNDELFHSTPLNTRDPLSRVSKQFWVMQSAMVLAGIFVGTFAGDVAAARVALDAIDPNMTYNGMTLADFSVEMGLSTDHPYLRALFEQLCMPGASKT